MTLQGTHFGENVVFDMSCLSYWRAGSDLASHIVRAVFGRVGIRELDTWRTAGDLTGNLTRELVLTVTPDNKTHLTESPFSPCTTMVHQGWNVCSILLLYKICFLCFFFLCLPLLFPSLPPIISSMWIFTLERTSRTPLASRIRLICKLVRHANS